MIMVFVLIGEYGKQEIAMKKLNPKDYRAGDRQTKYGVKVGAPGRKKALEENTVRIRAHEIRNRKAIQDFLKRGECPNCKSGHTLMIQSRPEKHYSCKVCRCTFQHGHYFKERKQYQGRLFPRNA